MYLIGLKTCSSCKQVEKQLKSKGLDYDYLDVRQNPPHRELLKKIAMTIGPANIKKMVNVSGQSYRQGNYKDVWAQLSFDQQLDALANDGMLIKRPILVFDQKVLIGKDVQAYLDQEEA